MTKTNDAPCARDLMTANPQTIHPEMPLAEITQFLLSHKLSNAPVVRQQGADQILVGFVSEADCLEHISNEMFYGMPVAQYTAQTIMKKHPVCVEPDADVFTIASIFISHGYRHLPVVQSTKLVGIVSRFDILKSLETYYADWNRAPKRHANRHSRDHESSLHRSKVTDRDL